MNDLSLFLTLFVQGLFTRENIPWWVLVAMCVYWGFAKDAGRWKRAGVAAAGGLVFVVLWKFTCSPP